MSAGAAVELIDDCEDVLLDPLGGRSRQEDPADAEVRRRPLPLGHERIRCLLHAVVRKAERPLGANQEILLESGPQGHVGAPLGCDSPTSARRDESTTRPMQAQSPITACVAGGKSFSLSTMNSTTLSVKPSSAILPMSQRQRPVRRSSAMRPRRSSSVRNWIAK